MIHSASCGDKNDLNLEVRLPFQLNVQIDAQRTSEKLKRSYLPIICLRKLLIMISGMPLISKLVLHLENYLLVTNDVILFLFITSKCVEKV